MSNTLLTDYEVIDSSTGEIVHDPADPNYQPGRLAELRKNHYYNVVKVDNENNRIYLEFVWKGS